MTRAAPPARAGSLRAQVAAFLAAHPQYIPEGWPDRQVPAAQPHEPPTSSGDSGSDSDNDAGGLLAQALVEEVVGVWRRPSVWGVLRCVALALIGLVVAVVVAIIVGEDEALDDGW